MKRYAIVSHHQNDQEMAIAGGQITGRVPIHDLIANYHWVRLDEEHVLMSAEYPASNHVALHKHEKVSMLSHVGSTRPILAHIHKTVHHSNKDKHWDSLSKAFDLDDLHTMTDLLEQVVAKHGPIFAPFS